MEQYPIPEGGIVQRKLLATLVISVLIVYVTPPPAQALTAPNGVVITQDLSAQSGTHKSYTAYYGGDSMNIAIEPVSSSLQTMSIDHGAVFLEFHLTTQSGQRTAESVTIHTLGSQQTTYLDHRAWNINLQTGEAVLTPAAQEAVALLGAGMSVLHSSEFYSAISTASDQITASGGGTCLASVLLFAAAAISLATCALVLPCAGAFLAVSGAAILVWCTCFNGAGC